MTQKQKTEQTDAQTTPDGRSTDLRDSSMMAHLMDALDKGTDIGHYGRLVFTMIARHFMDEDELVAYLAKDRDVSEEQARSLVAQVAEKDYSPPRREKILQYQQEQDFPIIPEADDPNAGNVYNELQFPQHVYDHISEYYEDRANS
jgi:hypothetical protein